MDSCRCQRSLLHEPAAAIVVIVTAVEKILQNFYKPLENLLSHHMEFRADLHSTASGYGKGMIQYLERIERLAHTTDEIPKDAVDVSTHWLYDLFYRTHPSNHRRFAAIKEAIVRQGA